MNVEIGDTVLLLSAAAGVAGLLRWSMTRLIADIDAKLAGIKDAQAQEAKDARRIELELAGLREELPKIYIRKDDLAALLGGHYARREDISRIDTKIDMLLSDHRGLMDHARRMCAEKAKSSE